MNIIDLGEDDSDLEPSDLDDETQEALVASRIAKS